MQNQSYEQTYQQHQQNTAAHADKATRMEFIRKTYTHLAGAIAAFVIVEIFLFMSGIAEAVIPMMVGGYSWLIVLALFMGVGYVADGWARSDRSTPLQYAGLGVTVVAYAVVFMPLMGVAVFYSSPMVLPISAGLTFLVFGALTAFVFITKQDFSFLRIAVIAGGLLAAAGIVLSIVMGFNLGIWFSVFMVGLMSIYILYTTSNIIHEYRTDQHVAASLALFSAVALLFYYILRIVMSFGD
ncbi:MAG: Bax inhibitor-1/YccA family protein [Myxococcota bacterium]